MPGGGGLACSGRPPALSLRQQAASSRVAPPVYTYEHCAQVGADRVGIRLSPVGGFLDAKDSHPYALTTYLPEELNK